MTIWNNKIFNCTKFVNGKGYVLEGEYKSPPSDKDVKVVIMNIYIYMFFIMVKRNYCYGEE